VLAIGRVTVKVEVEVEVEKEQILEEAKIQSCVDIGKKESANSA